MLVVGRMIGCGHQDRLDQLFGRAAGRRAVAARGGQAVAGRQLRRQHMVGAAAGQRNVGHAGAAARFDTVGADDADHRLGAAAAARQHHRRLHHRHAVDHGGAGCGGGDWMVSASAPLATEALPARSNCLAVRVCAPTASVPLVMLQAPLPSAVALPSSVVPSVSYSLTTALAAAVPVTTGVAILVMPSPRGPLSLATASSGAPGAVGASVSMVSTRPALATELLPAGSVWRTV